MSDKELWDALSVIARRMGLLERGQRLDVVGDPRDEPVRDDALCLAFGKYRETRLCCTYAKGHDRACSWVGAMIGKGACIARSPGTVDANLLCQRPTHHAGEHEATGTDGVRWTWGDAPPVLCGRVATDMSAVFNGTPCERTRGHEGNHEAISAHGQRIVFGAAADPHDPTTPHA